MGIEANVDEFQLLNILPFLSDYSRSNFLNGEYPLGLTPDETKMHQMISSLISAPDSLNLWLTYSVGTFGYDYKGFERYEAAYLMGELDLSDFLTFIPGVRWEEDFLVIMDRDTGLINLVKRLKHHPPNSLG